MESISKTLTDDSETMKDKCKTMKDGAEALGTDFDTMTYRSEALQAKRKALKSDC